MPFTTFFSPSPACQQLLLIFSASFVILCQGYVGINYGTQFSASPSADQVVALLRRQSITNIRLYDANGTILQALAHTGIQVMVTVPNTELLSVGQSNASAVNWVNTNVLAYLPATNITAICVGTEVLTTDPNAALVLVPAMKYLRVALLASNLSANIKISTSNDASLILDSFPPSQAYFNKSLTSSILVPMLDFLNSTGSFFMLNIYCYDIYKKSNGVILLDYALLNPITPDNVVTDSNTLFQYHNLFDAVLDACYFALAQLKYSTLPVVISEAGWPSGGDSSDKEATDENASTFISNLIAHVLNNSGTPSQDELQIALDWACGIGRANCTAIQPGQLCYEPDTVQAHASYAFNNYYQKNNRVSGSCDFNGVATISTTNPSTGVCMYPGSSSNGTSNLTSANTMANFTSGNSTNLTTADGNSNNTSSSTSLLYGISSFSLSPFHILFSLLVVLSFTSLF